MSVTRKAVVAAVAALALGGSMVGSTVPADAHRYTKEGSVSAKEANKLFKQAIKQKCLTLHEARHIVRGSGNLSDDEWNLVFYGTKKSHIVEVVLDKRGRCFSSWVGVELAAPTLEGSTVDTTAPADDYSTEGSVSAKEANKLFKQAIKQKCLTVHEARHIAHGNGELIEAWGWNEEPTGQYDLVFVGTRKSRILNFTLDIDNGCTAGLLLEKK